MGVGGCVWRRIGHVTGINKPSRVEKARAREGMIGMG